MTTAEDVGIMKPLALLTLLAAGCAARPAPVAAPAAASPPRPAASGPEPPHAPRLSVELRAEREGASLRVTVEVDGAPSDVAELRGALPSEPARLQASDAKGPLAARWARPAIAFDRAPVPPLRVSYALAPTELPWSLRVDPTELRASGDVLALPPAFAERRVPVRLRLGADGASDARAASTFGMGTELDRELRGRDLAGGFFLVGRLGDARFFADDGEDHAAWLGFFGFDPRWVAAEAAGVRAASDTWLGVRTPQRSGLLLFSVTRPEAPLAMRAFAGGVAVEVQTGAPWTAAARLRLGQELVGRWIGGALRLGAGEADRWWSDGASRGVAREVLFELGVLTPDERADELSALLSAEALSPVLAGAKAEPAEAARFATARGALLVALVDARVRKASGGKRGAREVFRALFRRAADARAAELPPSAFEEALAAELGPAAARELEDARRAPRPLPLPADLLAPCFRLEPRKVAPFELGVRLSRGEPAIVEHVAPGSAAERAGVRAGDRVKSLVYSDGRSDLPVRGVFVQAGAERARSWLPAGPSRPGRGFKKISSSPSC